MGLIAHSELGASNAARWMACPASPAACRGMPSTAGADAALGTAAHALGERCLIDGSNACDHIGSTFEGHVVDADMAADVQVYLDVVREYLRQNPKARLSVEERVDLSWIHPAMFGTADALIVEPWGECIVIDYKNGTRPVEVADNPQLAYYGLGAYFDRDVRRITCVVVQPRAIHPDGPVRSVTYSHEQMGEWADRFRAAAAATERPDAPRVPGDHCGYCPASATCPELHRHAVTVAQAEFAAVLKPPPPTTLTPAQLALVLDHADTIETWITAVRRHALALAEGGHPVPGYKLVEGRRGGRKWVNDAVAAQAIAALGVDPYEQSVLSPAALEKRLGKGAKAKLAELAEHITQSTGKPQLVPVGDRRAPAIPSAVSDFTAA